MTDLIPWLATDARAQPGATSLVDLVFGEQVLAMLYPFASCFSLGFAPIGWLLWRSSPRLRPAGATLLVGSVFLVGRAANTDPLRFAGDLFFLVAGILVVTALRAPKRIDAGQDHV